MHYSTLVASTQDGGPLGGITGGQLSAALLGGFLFGEFDNVPGPKFSLPKTHVIDNSKPGLALGEFDKITILAQGDNWVIGEILLPRMNKTTSGSGSGSGAPSTPPKTPSTSTKSDAMTISASIMTLLSAFFML